jgi:catechol 2,3-dioxygenase
VTDDTPALPAATRIGRAALRVADLDQQVEFYRDVVGLELRTQTDATATLGADGTPLLELERDTDAGSRGNRAGLFHTAFQVPSRTALGAALERIRDEWRLDGASDHNVSEALYLSDPEDNGVEIYRDRDRDQWPRAPDGSVRMDTLPLDLGAVADASDGATDAPPGTTLGHVHLEATDIGAARAFYVDTLGLGVQMDAGSALFLAAGGYHHHVGVNTWNGRSNPAGGRGLAWFEAVAPDEGTLAAVRDRLAAADIAVTERESGIAVADPDGIRLRIRVER